MVENIRYKLKFLHIQSLSPFQPNKTESTKILDEIGGAIWKI